MDRELRSRVHLLAPSVIVGKAGLTEGVLEQIKQRLKRERIIKVKFLSSTMSAVNKKELIKQLADRAESRVLHSVGYVVTLSRGLKGGKKQNKSANNDAQPKQHKTI